MTFFLLATLFFATLFLLFDSTWIIFALKRFKVLLLMKIKNVLHPLKVETEKRILCSVSEQTTVLCITV